MKLTRLVYREILHRRGAFLLGFAAVVFAVLCFVGSLSLLQAFDAETEEQVAAMEAETGRLLKQHEDDIRKAMKGLGFNIHIYPQEQDLAEIYAQGFGSATMPEDYVHRLADSEIVTVNHLLPRLTRMVEWQERDKTVLLFGVSGQVPIAFRGPNQKKPIMHPVEKGKIVLGYEMHRGTGLEVGGKLSLNGREFEVAKLHDRRGGIDDITAWIALDAAQEMFDQPGQINSILALECNCESIDRLGEIEDELKAILPGIQIVELESKALARALARNKAKELRERELAEFERGRLQQRATREAMIGLLVPLVAILGMAWIAYLTFVNAGQRLAEIGALRAIGVGSGKVFGAFLLRALLMGLAGGVVAFGTSLVFGISGTLDLWGWLAVIVCVPLLAAAAAWLPALVATSKDPAQILRHD